MGLGVGVELLRVWRAGIAIAWSVRVRNGRRAAGIRMAVVYTRHVRAGVICMVCLGPLVEAILHIHMHCVLVGMGMGMMRLLFVKEALLRETNLVHHST